MEEKKKSKTNLQSYLLTFSFVVFFWTIFDCVMTYITPLLIVEKGYSHIAVGLFIGSASVAGAVFDFGLCRFLKQKDFRKVFLITFALCSLYPLMLWEAKSIWFFLFTMSMWGLYFDLPGFGVFNFVGRYTKIKNHAENFGIIQLFGGVAGIVAPILVGLLISGKSVGFNVIVFAWIVLCASFLVFLFLLFQTRKKFKPIRDTSECLIQRNFSSVNRSWKKLGKVLFPVLFLTFFIYVIGSFFWTVSPLYVETTSLKQWGGLLLAACSLPAVVVWWYVKPLTKWFGTKRTAFGSLLIGSLILSLFGFAPNIVVALIIVFFAFCFFGLSFPAMQAAYGIYIQSAPEIEADIEGIEGLALNLGYLFGPIIGGVLIQYIPMAYSFSVMGLIGVVMSICLLIFTPRHINVREAV